MEIQFQGTDDIKTTTTDKMYVCKKKKKRHFKLVLTESVFYNINVTIYSTVIMCMTDVQIEIQILD